MPNPDPTPAPVGRRIGAGRTAEVWRRGDGTVVKVFVADRPDAWIDAEVAVSALVGSMRHEGYAVPAFHGETTHQDRRGMVLQEVVGDEMLALLGRRPWALISLARRLADVQVAVHRAGPTESVDQLPSYVERMARQIERVADALGPAAPVAVEELARLAADRPEVLCHGDFHPGNLLVGASGEVAVIDWTNAARGSAAMDVAMTTILLTCAEVPGSGVMRQVMILGRRAFHAAYRCRLRRTAPEVASESEQWLPVMAAARVADSPASEHPALLALAGRLRPPGAV